MHPAHRLICLFWLAACGLDSGGGGGNGSLNACGETSDCVVVPQSCCGSCGAATVGDAIAVALDHVSEQRAQACEGTIGCPACFSEDDPHLHATCEAARCELIDVRERDQLTGCNDASECVLRFRGCCACSNGSEANVIAIRGDAETAYQALTCDSDSACPECEPIFPSFLLPSCVNNRCVVSVLTD